MTLNVTSSKKPMHVLVTGGCGFIGSNFMNFIITAWPNAKFVNVDKLILNSDINYVSSNVKNSLRYKLVLGDIGNSELMQKVLRDNNVNFL